MASVPLLPSLGRDPRSQKRAKDRVKRQPAHGQSVGGKQTNAPLSPWHSFLSPQASAEHGDLGISGKHHPRLAAMLSPSIVPKLHPAALSPADVALFPTSLCAAEGSEMGNPRQVALKQRAALATGFPPAPPRPTERARKD